MKSRYEPGQCPHTGQTLNPLPDPALADFGVSPATGAVHFLKAHALNYDDDYFLSEYREQYGKTYIEDEANLRRLARRRLGLLPEASPGADDRPRLLEIGCACGFFLDEAREAGYDVEGLEISPYAVNFAREQLGLKIHQGSFLEEASATPPAGQGNTEAPAETFDVIAAFFVLEHFADQAGAFERIASLLKPGGLFLFALPSIRGPLFECDPAAWARTHPADHFADYGPLSIRMALSRYGLRTLRTRPMSYHPDRACGLRGKKFMRPFYRMLADLQCFGDTMEGIALNDTRVRP